MAMAMAIAMATATGPGLDQGIGRGIGKALAVRNSQRLAGELLIHAPPELQATASQRAATGGEMMSHNRTLPGYLPLIMAGLFTSSSNFS